jgi:hypothetical protein
MNWFRENISYDVKKTLLMNLRELKGSKSKPKDDAAMHLEEKNTRKKKTMHLQNFALCLFQISNKLLDSLF